MYIHIYYVHVYVHQECIHICVCVCVYMFVHLFDLYVGMLQCLGCGWGYLSYLSSVLCT